jgi:hypothetical protein
VNLDDDGRLLKNCCGHHLLRCAGARSLAYRLDMSRLLRAVRRASGLLATFFSNLIGHQGLRFVAAFFAMFWHTARRVREAEHDVADHGLGFGSWRVGGVAEQGTIRGVLFYPRGNY